MMGPTTDPIICGPYDPPLEYFELGIDGSPTGTLVPGRRPSESFVPVPAVVKRGRRSAPVQEAMDLGDAGERREVNTLINDIRRQVSLWRDRNYPGVTAISRKLMSHWADPERENRVLFCQREAAETAIYLAEAAGRHGEPDFRTRVDPQNELHNDRLPRVGLKMATGSGKTVVMAMLIAWQTLNKVHSPNDARFAKRFLVVAPGITIRDRLRVLLPSDPGNYYRLRDLVPADLAGLLGEAHVLIVNYHQFLLRDRREIQGVARNTRLLLTAGKKTDTFVETPDEMAARVLRDFTGRGRREIVVLNDEAHHCYQDKPLEVDEAGAVDAESAERNADARVWFKGLQAVRRKVGIKTIYDLSATPFYLKGSGHTEGFIFPWVVSDFSLMDAIESGIVKIPRLPVDDDAEGDVVTYRDLWRHVGTRLPKRKPRLDDLTGEWPIPDTLEGALHSLYRSYASAFADWERRLAPAGEPPPVFIVVCPNTVVSKLVYEWIAGADVDLPDVGMRTRPGHLELLSNVIDGVWVARPRTILVDSAQLESGNAMKADFKDAASREIEQFKRDMLDRDPSADVDQLTDEDLLREVMNTVGKQDRLGEHVRRVSVSMLTEGWDANTVTHIVGVRAFRSRLLCEQVVGRALRRRSYALNDEGRFDAEYDSVYGVPFDFVPSDVNAAPPKPRQPTVEVRSLPDRSELRITFPRVDGYRVEVPDETLRAEFTTESHLHLDRTTVATWTQAAGIVGEAEEHELEQFASARPKEVAFAIAKRLLERYAVHDDAPRPWLFPRLVAIAQQWIDECVTLGRSVTIGLLLLAEGRTRAAEKIFAAVAHYEGSRREILRPLLLDADPGSTDGVSFFTRKTPIPTSRSHVSHVVLDGVGGNRWEETIAGFLERHDRVDSYVKNDHVGFTVPYLYGGVRHDFIPDFLVRLAAGSGNGDEQVRTLIVEVSGGRKVQDQRETKATTARDQWCVAVNNHGAYGRWGFVEIADMLHAAHVLDGAITDLYADGAVTGAPE